MEGFWPLLPFLKGMRGMKRSEPKIERGTVIGIPLPDGSYVISQVYSAGVNFYLFIFRALGNGLFDEGLLNQAPILGSWTNDAEVYRWSWKLFEKHPVAEGIFEEPSYKVFLQGVEHRESFDGKRFVPFAGKEDDGAVFRKVRSPALVQAVVEAYFGHGEWLASYDAMRLGPRVE